MAWINKGQGREVVTQPDITSVLATLAEDVSKKEPETMLRLVQSIRNCLKALRRRETATLKFDGEKYSKVSIDNIAFLLRELGAKLQQNGIPKAEFGWYAIPRALEYASQELSKKGNGTRSQEDAINTALRILSPLPDSKKR